MTDEVARRFVHVSGAAFPLAHVAGLVTWPQLRVLLVAGTLVAAVLEALRLFGGLEWWLFDKLTREYEQDNPAGYALYVFGGTVAALAFESAVAVPALLMLTIADPISGLMGSGELQAIKSAGVLAVTFGVCLGLALPFLPVRAAVLGAAAATLADGAKPILWGYVIDDNVTIPIGAAAASYAGLQFVPAVFG